MIRVGFIILPSKGGWLGGVNYLRNLCIALNSVSDDVRPVVLVADRKDFPPGFPTVETVKSSVLRPRSLSWYFRMSVREVLDRDLVLESVLRRCKIDVLSHSCWLGRTSGVPAVTWIPDFQHVHLPDFFSADEVQYRNKGFIKRIEQSTLVVVSSEMARSDFVQFAPKYAHKVRVLKFADCSASGMQGTSAEQLKKKYSLPGTYFLLPNQFWVHKNHLVVIQALSLLKKRFPEIRVVATGSTNDFRHPKHYAELKKHLARLEVNHEFQVLGVVPYEDLAGLMQNAMAIINPSFFEGWSTTVEEAKSLGKATVLSNIPVHLEQAPPNSRYFDPHNSAELAAHLASIWEDSANPQWNNMCEQTKFLAESRKMEFAQTFRRILGEATRL